MVELSQRRSGSGLRAYRPWLITLLVALYLLLLIETGIFSRQQAIEQLEWQAASHLERYTLSLQQKLDRYKDLPHLLTTHSDLYGALSANADAADLERANLYLEQVNHIVGTTDAYLMDAAGVTVAASNWRNPDTFIGRNFSFRPYFQDAMHGREGRYFALGTTSNKRGYYFSYPMYRNQQVIGAVIVKIDLHDVERHWSIPNVELLVTDEDGIIFISTRPEWKFRSLQPLEPPELQRIVSSLRYGDTTLSTLDVVRRETLPAGGELITLLDGRKVDGEGIDALVPRQYLLQRRQVPGFGLQVSVLASLEPVERQMWQALLLVGCGTAAGALLVLFLLARRRMHNERVRFRQREIRGLEESEARVSAIIDNTHAGLILLDARGMIQSFNPTAEKLFGYRIDEIGGHYFSQLLAEEDRAVCWRHILAQEADAPGLLSIEANARCKGGKSLPVDLTINRMSLADGRYFIVTTHDLSQQKEHEQQLKAAQEALETRVQERTRDLSRTNARLVQEMEQHRRTQNELIQTAKLAVLGQMSAGINHELNQPLTAIRNYADNGRAFLKRGNLEQVEHNLSEISGLTERMRKIIHPLKEFARKSSEQTEPVSLQVVRDGAMSLMYGRFEKEGVEIEWPRDLAQQYVRGDILRLEQVLVNLLGNAVQALEQSPRKRIEVGLSTQGDWLCLSVRDYGPGIADADLKRVFEPFFTTKQSGQGLGLGLSISHRIVETLGGRLSVANHPEGGAVFSMELPRVAALPADAVVGKRQHDEH